MIYYDFLDRSPVGPVLICASSRGLAAVVMGRRGREAKLRKLATMLPGEEFRPAPRQVAPYRRQIQDYLAGKLRRFACPVDLAAVRSSFQRRVLQACRRIPYGRTVSYGELAAAVGSPGAARAVGQALGRNPVPLVVPCHRVVAADGSLGGFSAGVSLKRKLLLLEGSITPRARTGERKSGSSSPSGGP